METRLTVAIKPETNTTSREDELQVHIKNLDLLSSPETDEIVFQRRDDPSIIRRVTIKEFNDLPELELVAAEQLAAKQASEEAATRAAEVVLEEQPEDTE